VVDYFRIAVDLYKTLPTFEVCHCFNTVFLHSSNLKLLQFLASAGILPSKTKIYDRDEINAALTAARNVTAVVGCQGVELREVWYFFKVRGSLLGGEFVAAEPDASGVGGHFAKWCPKKLRYLPKEV
jgi:ribonuclease T2